MQSQGTELIMKKQAADVRSAAVTVSGNHSLYMECVMRIFSMTQLIEVESVLHEILADEEVNRAERCCNEYSASEKSVQLHHRLNIT